MTRIAVAFLTTLIATLPSLSADDLRSQAEACAARGDHAEASRCFRVTATYYRSIGDEQAALIFESRADQYEPILRGFRDRPAGVSELRRFYTAQKAEPIYGCYIGVNCFADPNCSNFDAFCAKVGKRHALFYDYGYEGGTGSDQACLVQPEGPWLQAATELRHGLSGVLAGRQLDAWAQALGRVEGTVFLRWASEMNGDWVSWHGDPALYIRKWRLVHDAMARFAPNVVMVWCPNATPVPQVDRYYPGDGYVDWVGVNFYIVSIHDNEPGRPANRENPSDLFRHIYETYAARKPMMICETGVTHRAQALSRPDYSFAEARLGQLYGCLPRLYPRVKAICYYDVNNLNGSATGRPFNNYLLTDHPRVLNAYRRAIAPDYFLGGPQQADAPLPAYTEPLSNGMTLSGQVHLSAWAKSYHITPVVRYCLDGKLLGASAACGTYDCALDCTAVPPGEHTLTLAMETEQGKVLKTVKYRVNVQPGV